MTGPSETNGGPLRPRVAVAFAVVAFIALAICGLGITSLALDADVISIPGGGQIPGVAGLAVAMAVFAGTLTLGLRAQHPSYWTAPVAAIATYLSYGGGVLIGAIFAGIGPAAALAAGGRSLVSWFGVVVALAALVCAWGGVALVRTRAARPRWRWERDEDE